MTKQKPGSFPATAHNNGVTKTSRMVPATEASQAFELQLEAKYSDHCQKMLDCLLAFSYIIDREDYDNKLRTIKDLFLKRDFNNIFENPKLLPYYVVEYIPGRSLCYRDLFIKIPQLLEIIRDGERILCLGGGNGAELLAIGSLVGMFQNNLSMNIIDLSDYNVIPTLMQSIVCKFNLQNKLNCTTTVQDLCSEDLDLSPLIKETKLITCCFVLNEILTSSKLKFARLVTQLTKHMPRNCLLLVVDSAGSFSETQIGSNSEKYMLFDLLDAIKVLKKVTSHNSVWYRYQTELTYPRKINNMRFLLRLYQKV